MFCSGWFPICGVYASKRCVYVTAGLVPTGHNIRSNVSNCPHLPHTCLQIQLLRIQLRVPEYGWTTQKVFHLLNCLVCGLRAGTFLFREQMQTLHPDALRLVLFDLPGELRSFPLHMQMQI